MTAEPGKFLRGLPDNETPEVVHAPHLLYLELGREWISARVECPGTEAGRCRLFQEGTWSDASECRCKDPECPCRDGDHGGCSDFSGQYVGELGYECRCIPMDGVCGVEDFMREMSVPELLHGPEAWPDNGYPVKADVDWIDGYPCLVPWPDEEVS